MVKKLNLKWVTDVIADDYKNWKDGDIISIKAQTGTGKTYFIVKVLVNNMQEHEEMIYICNRIALKRQIKKDLLKKYNKEIPVDKNGNIDLRELDKMETIGNVTIVSYHQISNLIMRNKYTNTDYNLDHFAYIVCDECHFFLTDASFYNKCVYAFDELIKKHHKESKTIFITATDDEIDDVINKAYAFIKDIGFGTRSGYKLHKYSTGIDYSYLDIKYFNNIKNIVQLIKNDRTEDKWLIFVVSKQKGNYIKESLLQDGIPSVFIEAGSKDEEVENIIDNEKFECKVLVTTKVLDNGVNIKDEKVKNIVISSYDKVTFMQELGRVRIDIENARDINLYIDTMSKKGFKGKIDKVYLPKIIDVELFEKNLYEFKLKYNNDTDKLYHDLFYLDTDNNWKINSVGRYRLNKDRKFASDMIKLLHNDSMAYVKEQLKWLNMENTYSENNLIEEVFDLVKVNELSHFLESAYESDEKFTKDYFIEYMNNVIDSNDRLRIVFNNLDNGKKRSKGQKKYNELFSKLNLNYIVSSKPKEEKINGKRKKKTYWMISKIEI